MTPHPALVDKKYLPNNGTEHEVQMALKKQTKTARRFRYRVGKQVSEMLTFAAEVPSHQNSRDKTNLSKSTLETVRLP